MSLSKGKYINIIIIILIYCYLILNISQISKHIDKIVRKKLIYYFYFEVSNQFLDTKNSLEFDFLIKIIDIF